MTYIRLGIGSSCFWNAIYSLLGISKPNDALIAIADLCNEHPLFRTSTHHQAVTSYEKRYVINSVLRLCMCKMLHCQLLRYLRWICFQFIPDYDSMSMTIWLCHIYVYASFYVSYMFAHMSVLSKQDRNTSPGELQAMVWIHRVI